MQRVRLAIIGAGPITEWTVLPALLSPDAVSPPDTGAWWSRRPVADSEIRYQAPASPEVVAIADADAERAARVAATAHVAASYGDWRSMLREVQPDALLCVTTPDVVAPVIAAAASAGVRWLWLDGPPAFSVSSALQMVQQLQGLHIRLWCARPLRHAAAHRAARQLVEHDQIGAVSALTLRWSTPFTALPKIGAASRTGSVLDKDEAWLWASSYSALDVLLAFGTSSGSDTAVPEQVLAGAAQEATSLWMRFANGVTATALFAGADTWSTPLPRLEICGTQGRSVVCEAGRRMWLHMPREASRLLEPPGLTAHVTAANIIGIAEDLKAFLAACVERPQSVEQSDNTRTTPEVLLGAARCLQLMQAINDSLDSGRCVQIEPLRLGVEPGGTSNVEEAPAPPPPMTLPLQLQ